MSSVAETAARLYENRQALKANPGYSEADTVSHLIDPVLNCLGYPATRQTRENQADQNRPDIVLWNAPHALRGSAPAWAILEAKPMGYDLNGNGRARAERPKEQIRRYVTGYIHSRPGTLGILTDGDIWHVIRRGAAERQVILINEWRLFEDGPEQTAQRLLEISAALNAVAADLMSGGRPSQATARAVCEAIAAGKPAAEILRLLTGRTEFRSDLKEQVQLLGKAQQAEADHWQAYAYQEAGQIRAEQADAAHEAVCAAVAQAVNAETPEDAVLFRGDTALAAAAFAQAVPLKMSATLLTQPGPDGVCRAARLAVHYQGHTGMTAEFNPVAPSPLTLKTIQRVCDLLRSGKPALAKALTETVAARGVRKDFYQQIANGWTLRRLRRDVEYPDQMAHAYREAVLRHLIRVVFAWILKEEGQLPPEVFDEAFARRETPDQYHRDLLSFLFHERLNRPVRDRVDHANPRVNAALADARFLNGSLFARHQDDDLLKLDDVDYFGVDENDPGLFTILSEYDWTASEHTPHSSDQTIDPEVLSNLFENLIAVAKHGEATPDRMPEGTYYTPADVAQEMVKDALTEAVIEQAPATWERGDLRRLFGAEDELPPAATESERRRLVARIRELTIYDPAVGSGEFPFLCMLALRGALVKLGVPDDGGAVTRDIIARQLFAQDINPMAVQVARLRLFIAIIAAEGNAGGAKLPLPNLEAKIVCADTLATVADPNWTPFGGGTLQAQVHEVNEALAQVANIRERWQSAHDEPSKVALRREDKTARDALLRVIPGRMVDPETKAFAEHPLLDPDAPPAETDPRLLFYGPDRQGFDIVIGNPPYESVNADLKESKNDSKERKRELARLRQDRRRRLIEQKRYRTTAGNDLYNLIAEAALTLVRPAGGVVELVVPLSLCWRYDKHDLRRLFEERCRRVSLRCSDNRPDKVFHESPVANAESRVRATIVNAVTGADSPVIEVSHTGRWRKAERREYLRSRPRYVTRRPEAPVDPRIDTQWERIATPEIRELITAMRNEPVKIRDLRQAGENQYALACPPSAMYFITATPAGALKRREDTLPIAQLGHLELAVAAANTHAAYAWWQAFSSAFDVYEYERETIAIPGKWFADAATNRRARELGRELIAAVNSENTSSHTTGTKGKVQDSLNFYECAPDVIAALDNLYLDALGLPRAPLLEQLHILRSDSSWRLGATP